MTIIRSILFVLALAAATSAAAADKVPVRTLKEMVTMAPTSECLISRDEKGIAWCSIWLKTPYGRHFVRCNADKCEDFPRSTNVGVRK